MGKITSEETIKLAAAMREYATSEIFEDIKKKIASGSDDVSGIVTATFHIGVAENSARRTLEVFKYTINLLQTADLPHQDSNEIISFLMAEVDSFPTSLLMEMCEYFVIQLKSYCGPNEKWLDVLPSLLSSLASRDTIVYDGNDMSGKELKRNVIHAVCSSKLEPRSVAQLVPVLCGVKLTNDETKQFVKVALSALSKLKYQEMPSFVYELLKFPAGNYRKNILQDVMSYFIEEDRKMRNIDISNDSDSEDILGKPDCQLFHQIEGSVILMIQLCCNQEPVLIEVFLQTFKSFQYMSAVNLSSFIFSVAFSLTSIEACEQPILNVMKSILFNTFRQKEICHQSHWARKVFPHVIESDVIDHIKEVVVHSKHGWDHVSQGLIKFGFVLLDMYGPKPVFGKQPNLSKPHAMTVSEQSCSAGSTILRKAFKSLQNARAKIFEEILNRIIIKTSGPVSHYIDVLSRTVQNDPQLLLEVLQKVMTILEYLPFLPYNNALGVLKALTPLIKISMPLKDALMIVLGKAMFHCDIEPRKIAIAGYLAILKKIGGVSKMSMSESQCSTSSQVSTNSLLSQPNEIMAGGSSVKSKSMCLEIMGILKRSLVQQAEVKRLLYEGLHDVVLKNAGLSDIILELLLSHFDQFFNLGDDHSSPINLSKCVCSLKDATIISEPLPYLVAVVCLILLEVKNRFRDSEFEDYEQGAQTTFEDKLKVLTDKMKKTELEEFHLEETDDSIHLNAAASKKEKLFLLLGVYDALIEYSVMDNSNWCVESCEELLSLTHKSRKITETLQVKNLEKKSKAKTSVITLPPSLITMRCLSRVLENLLHNDCEAHQSGLRLLRSDDHFTEYILDVCVEKLTLLNKTGMLDGFSDNMSDNYDYICNMARVLLRAYTNGLQDICPSIDFDDVSFSLIEGLNQIFSYMFTHDAEVYEKFISDIAKQIPSANGNSASRVVKKFQRLIVKVLSDVDDDERLKEVIPLLSIIGHICSIPSVYKESEVYEWAKQLCVEQSFQDVSLSKKLLALCLNLCHQQEDCMHFLQEVASDIHFNLGNSDSDTPVDGAKTYKLIEERASLQLLPLIIRHIEKILGELKLVLNVLKAEVTFSRNSMHVQTSDYSKNDTTEDSICKLLVDLIKVFHELILSAIPIGNNTQLLGQTTASFYKILTMVCRYYTSLYDQQIGRICSSFEATVKFCVTHLTPQVYSFMTYVESVDENNKKKKPSSHVAKATRNMKTQSGLVFAVEEYEQCLMQLAAKAKKNWAPFLKISTSRDFRIIVEAIENQLEENGEQSEMPSTNASSHIVSVTESEVSSTKRKAESKLTAKNKRKKTSSK